MAQRKKLIIGNWKMHLNVHDSSLFLHKLEQTVHAHRNVEIVLAPTMLTLQTLSLQINRRQFKLAAQNFYSRDYGAFTGEVSATQLNGIVDYGLVGHSERRHIFGETEKQTREKVQAALRNKISPILCVGETSQERADNETGDVIHGQLVAGLANVTSDEIERVVVAYEPVWAIGTGENARPGDVEKVVKVIRRNIEHMFGKKKSQEVKVLYGGSVKPDSAKAYLATPGVDGLLVGGASLNERDFAAIVDKAHECEV